MGGNGNEVKLGNEGKSENTQKQLELVLRQVWNLLACGICSLQEVVVTRFHSQAG